MHTYQALESNRTHPLQARFCSSTRSPENQVLKVQRISGARLSIGVESVDLKPKRFDEAKEKTETSTSAEAPDKTNCRSS